MTGNGMDSHILREVLGEQREPPSEFLSEDTDVAEMDRVEMWSKARVKAVCGIAYQYSVYINVAEDIELDALPCS